MERKTLTRKDLPTEDAGWRISLDRDGVVRLDPHWWDLPLRLTFLVALVVCCCFYLSFANLLWQAHHFRGAGLLSLTPIFIGFVVWFSCELVQVTRWRLGKQFIEEERVSLFGSVRRRRYRSGCLVISPDSHYLSVWPLGEREKIIVSGDNYTTARFGLFIARETGWRMQRR
ncbi:MAG: hypothetical protein M3Y56_10875 [Armatimonadota bacterium]|nr:hypothetical protein [Armatimonadota bacterium]